MDIEPVSALSLFLFLWFIGIAIVYCGGVVPTHWQNDKTAALVSFIGIPLALAGIALVIAYPALIILFVIIAAAGPK